MMSTSPQADGETRPHKAPAPEALIADAQRGDQRALEQLLECYRNYLRLLSRTSLDNELGAKVGASDLVQETLIKAHARFDQFRGRTEKELVGWLRSILARHLVDLVRRFELNAGRRLARERRLDAAIGRSSMALARFVAARGESPSAEAQRRELGVFLADALSQLDPDHREVIILRNLEELDWKEVGRLMNRSPDAARMLWTRGLMRLRPLIEAAS
jgi:RNA polymerase sigma-70 factor (ECF subfamily)